MDIRINNIINFKSKANPIRPFIVRTKQGRFKVSEVSRKDLKMKDFFVNLTKFFCKNFASLTKDPSWKIFQTPKNIDYEKAFNDLVQYYRAKVMQNDDNMTLLLVKNKRNKIQGACLSYGYDGISGVKDKVCYIDSIAVSANCRRFNFGKILIEKTLESAKNTFSDAFLTGDRETYGFYKKLRFEPLKSSDKDQKFVIDYISKTRSDYPKYVELFTKPLQENKKRWYKNIEYKSFYDNL